MAWDKEGSVLPQFTGNQRPQSKTAKHRTFIRHLCRVTAAFLLISFAYLVYQGVGGQVFRQIKLLCDLFAMNKTEPRKI